jgi:hypothetical protein
MSGLDLRRVFISDVVNITKAPWDIERFAINIRLLLLND